MTTNDMDQIAMSLIKCYAELYLLTKEHNEECLKKVAIAVRQLTD